MSSIHYRITPINPQAHLFAVELTIAQPLDGQCLRLPAWIPGSYLVRDFARHLSDVRASCNGQSLALHKLDKDSWQIAACSSEVCVSYTVYAWDLSVRGAYLDERRGFFNATSVCLEVVGQGNAPCEVEFCPPSDPRCADWRVATTLPRAGAAEWGFGTYRAECYDTLLDHPVELGVFAQVDFAVAGVRHDIVVSGQQRGDLARLARDVARVCQYQITLFGGRAPFTHYLFMLFVGDDIYGGLEHRDSTALMACRDDLPQLGDAGLSEGYIRLLGLFSHEYFHCWNVKRIKPAQFQPYDLRRESHTRLLWAFEGVTSYYDDLALVRSGVLNPEHYLTQLAHTITSVQRGYGRTRQTLEEASFDAWTRHYKPDENSPNAIVSYYTKGSLVALALDLTLRERTQGRCSLDDVMRALWQRYLENGQGIGEQEWEAIATRIAGIDLSAFFQQALRSTDDLPLAELLATVGVTLEWRVANKASDLGGVGLPATTTRVSLGVKASPDPQGIKLVSVHALGSACRAGLSAGDVIIAIDGVRARDLDKQLASYAAGETIEIYAFRRDELRKVCVTIDAAPADTCWLSFSGEQVAAWLGTA